MYPLNITFLLQTPKELAFAIIPITLLTEINESYYRNESRGTQVTKGKGKLQVNDLGNTVVNFMT